jgi:hyperosmotically inducible protein
MNAKLFVTTGLIVGAMAMPALSHAEGFKEAVKDSIITTKIKAEMAKDKSVSAMHIKVETDANGVVQLSGTAKSQSEADKAVTLAKAVKGVTSVDNQIKVQEKQASTK